VNSRDIYAPEWIFSFASVPFETVPGEDGILTFEDPRITNTRFLRDVVTTLIHCADSKPPVIDKNAGEQLLNKINEADTPYRLECSEPFVLTVRTIQGSKELSFFQKESALSPYVKEDPDHYFLYCIIRAYPGIKLYNSCDQFMFAYCETKALEACRRSKAQLTEILARFGFSPDDFKREKRYVITPYVAKLFCELFDYFYPKSSADKQYSVSKYDIENHPDDIRRFYPLFYNALRSISKGYNFDGEEDKSSEEKLESMCIRSGSLVYTQHKRIDPLVLQCMRSVEKDYALSLDSHLRENLLDELQNCLDAFISHRLRDKLLNSLDIERKEFDENLDDDDDEGFGEEDSED